MFQSYLVNKKSKTTSSLKKNLTRVKYSNEKEHYSKKRTKPDVLVAITLRKAISILSKQQGIYLTLKKI